MTLSVLGIYCVVGLVILLTALMEDRVNEAKDSDYYGGIYEICNSFCDLFGPLFIWPILFASYMFIWPLIALVWVIYKLTKKYE